MHSALHQSWPLKIGLLTHSVNPRGGVVHTLELATALHAAGHTVTVYAPALPGQFMFRHVPFQMHLIPVQPHKDGMVGMVATRISAMENHLNRVLLEEQFDVFHAQDPIGANALANLQEQRKIESFIRTVHHLDTFDDPRLMHWQSRGMHAAAAVLCVSQVWCEVLRREHGIKARVVQNGVDLQRYSRISDESDVALKARWGLRGGRYKPVVLAVGGIEERKNTLRILQAFALLREQYPEAQLVIAGGTSLLDHDAYGREFQSWLRTLKLNTGVGADIVITGALPDADMPALFRCSDVLAMPSLREGFGLVVLEALACGTPVVASNIAPFTEYLSNSDCCWADPLDSSSIESALQMALMPERAKALQTTPAVCERFSWDVSAARHSDYYHAHVSLVRHRLRNSHHPHGESYARYAL